MKYRGITLTSGCAFAIQSAAHSLLFQEQDGSWCSSAVPTAGKIANEDIQKLCLMGAVKLVPGGAVASTLGRAAVERDSEAFFGDLASHGFSRRLPKAA